MTMPTLTMQTFHAEYSLNGATQSRYVKTLKHVAQRLPALLKLFEAVPGWTAWPTEMVR